MPCTFPKLYWKQLYFLQAEYPKDINQPNNKKQGFIVIKKNSIALLQFVHQMCLTRNGHLHVTNQTNTKAYKHLQLIQKITELYERVNYTLAADRGIFAKLI